MIKISIVVPFFNESKNLEYFIKEWSNFFKENEQLTKKYYFKFFFFNDGSSDDSIKTIKKTKKLFEYEIINKINSGHGDTCIFAYKYLIKLNKFDYLLQIDSDNQCAPNYLISFLNYVPNNDFIFGKRIKREDGILRLASTKILSFSVFFITGRIINDLNVPYRVMRCSKLKPLLSDIPEKVELRNAYLTYLIHKLYGDINWVKIVFRKRQYGLSHFNSSKMFKFFIDLLKSIKSSRVM